MSRIDDLLIQLNNESKYNPLNESFDFDSIYKRFLSLREQLLASNGLTNTSLSEDQLALIDEVKHININDSFRVVTYPNIHHEKKYKIDASIIFNFVMRQIDENASSGGENFNATDVVQQAISYTLKYLIGSTPAKYITIDEFKKEYQTYVFGSYKKVQVKPRIIPLTILADRNPIIISYIDNKLLVGQINRLTDYSKKVDADFKRLLRNDESLKYILNSYMSCIERSIRALVNIYKIIRNTFIELQHEYFNIFNQIKRINNINRVYIESCIKTNNYLHTLNEAINKFDTLNESVTEEDGNVLEYDINNLWDEFMNIIQDKLSTSRNIRDTLYKHIYLVSKFYGDKTYNIFIHKGLYSIDDLLIAKIKSFINNISIENSDNLNINEVSKKLSNMFYSDKEIDDINILRRSIRNDIIGDYSNYEVNIDQLSNNVLKLLATLTYINDYYYKTVFENNKNIITNKYKESIYYIRNILIGTTIIVDSIYFSILDLLQEFITILLEYLQ